MINNTSNELTAACFLKYTYKIASLSREKNSYLLAPLTLRSHLHCSKRKISIRETRDKFTSHCSLGERIGRRNPEMQLYSHLSR